MHSFQNRPALVQNKLSHEKNILFGINSLMVLGAVRRISVIIMLSIPFERSSLIFRINFMIKVFWINSLILLGLLFGISYLILLSIHFGGIQHNIQLLHSVRGRGQVGLHQNANICKQRGRIVTSERTLAYRSF